MYSVRKFLCSFAVYFSSFPTSFDNSSFQFFPIIKSYLKNQKKKTQKRNVMTFKSAFTIIDRDSFISIRCAFDSRTYIYTMETILISVKMKSKKVKLNECELLKLRDFSYRIFISYSLDIHMYTYSLL